jgi:hypothetical protein
VWHNTQAISGYGPVESKLQIYLTNGCIFANFERAAYVNIKPEQIKSVLNGLKLPQQRDIKAAVSVGLLVSLSGSAIWADGYNYGSSNYNRVYTSQLSRVNTYPQYYSRIEPDTSFSRTQTNYSPQSPDPYPYTVRASANARTPRHKSLSTKISDGFSDLFKNPTTRSGLTGAGIGLGAAALTERNLWRGTWVGAAYGTGVGLMDESVYFKRHPLVRRSAKGALIGLGAATVTGAAALGSAAAVGAGIGAGVHYLRTH